MNENIVLKKFTYYDKRSINFQQFIPYLVLKAHILRVYPRKLTTPVWRVRLVDFALTWAWWPLSLATLGDTALLVRSLKSLADLLRNN